MAVSALGGAISVLRGDSLKAQDVVETVTPEQHQHRVSDATLRGRTGRNWNEWIQLLDAAGARDLSHKQIVAIVDHHLPGLRWWVHIVTAGYEQARGLKAKDQKPGSCLTSRSKVVGAPLARLYAAWTDLELRAEWLDAPVVIREATPERSLRMIWSDWKSNVGVRFTPKGEGRCQVNVHHSKLEDPDAAATMNAYWGARLERLKARLES